MKNAFVLRFSHLFNNWCREGRHVEEEAGSRVRYAVDAHLLVVEEQVEHHDVQALHDAEGDLADGYEKAEKYDVLKVLEVLGQEISLVLHVEYLEN